MCRRCVVEASSVRRRLAVGVIEGRLIGVTSGSRPTILKARFPRTSVLADLRSQGVPRSPDLWNSAWRTVRNKSAISEGDLAVQLAVLLDTWAATQAPFGADRVLRARCERDENSESWTVVDVENARGHSWLEWIAWH